MIQLAAILERIGAAQSAMARDLGVSRSTLNALVRTGRPIRRLAPGAVGDWLEQHGATAAERITWDEPAPESGQASPTPSSAGVQAGTSEDTEMLIAAQTLEDDELERLGLARNPFRNDVRSHADVFLPPSHRRVREAMWQAAQHRGLIAVVGESGSGKTVLRRDVLERAVIEDQTVVPIMPYTLGMEASEGGRGSGLRATDIAEMIIRRLEPSASLRASRQGRYHQAESVLTARVRAGQKPVLFIEEAHRMSKATLRHLKGFAELEMGHLGMLAIILIGQIELADTLSETDPTIREVVQRFQVIRLAPLDDVPGYLRHKFARVGGDLDSIAEPDALTAIQDRLSGAKAGRRAVEAAQVRSLCYPLAAQNLLVISLKAALQVGRFTRLTRDHVEAV